MMRLRKLSVLLLAVCPACLADVADAPDDPIGSAAEPGILPVRGKGGGPGVPHFEGQCADTCYDIASDLCGAWEDECAPAYPQDRIVTCAGKTVSCDAAQHAAEGSTFGISYCWRDCMGFRN
jgi:hypothetical protein